MAGRLSDQVLVGLEVSMLADGSYGAVRLQGLVYCTDTSCAQLGFPTSEVGGFFERPSKCPPLCDDTLVIPGLKDSISSFNSRRLVRYCVSNSAEQRRRAPLYNTSRSLQSFFISAVIHGAERLDIVRVTYRACRSRLCCSTSLK